MVLNIPDKYNVRVTFPTTRQVGDVFNKLAPFLKMYTTFVDHYDAAMKCIQVSKPYVGIRKSGGVACPE